MRGQRPTFGDREAQGQRRAVQAAVLRRRRLAVMQPPERVASLSRSPIPDTTPPKLFGDDPDRETRAAIYERLFGTTGSLTALPPGEYYRSPTPPPTAAVPWQDQAETPLPLKVSEETAYHRGWREPPNLPPSDLDTAGASWSDTRATFAGEGAFSADATVVSPPEPVAGILAASVEPLGLSRMRIETDYTNLLLLAISLEKMARDEIARLSSERPNDPSTIESNKKQSDLLYILAEAFAKFAAALEEYSKRPQPLLAGKAKEVVNWAGTQLQAWWEANAVEGRDLLVRLPVIDASLALFGLAVVDMHFATPLVGALVGGPKAIAAIKAALPTGGLGKKAK